MNKVIMIGNLAADPEARTTQSGVSCASFRLAVQRSYKNAAGVYEADFFPVVAWRQTADFINTYMAKGRKLCVEGTLQTRSYDGQDGQRRYVTEIIAERVEALGSPRREDAADPGPTPPPARPERPERPEQQKMQYPVDEDGFLEAGDDDDLPF